MSLESTVSGSLTTLHLIAFHTPTCPLWFFVLVEAVCG